PPAMTHSSPSSSASSFPVGSRVTFSCSGGARRIPGMPDTVECLPGDIWSRLAEPCGRSCAAPTRLRFAALSKEDERRNFFPVGTNVSYVCRPGYENSSEISPSSTCLENLTWSQPAELCRSEYSCCPTAPKAALVTNGNHNGQDKAFFTAGMSVRYSCDPGYYLVGNAAVTCRASGNWSQPRPRCEGEPGLCPSGSDWGGLCGHRADFVVPTLTAGGFVFPLAPTPPAHPDFQGLSASIQS
uniref:Sushi domain-containing protein n=1 Tax=Zonotrichia albicollis TaxID=44394 RepID=A0A8D2MVP1_ZONAL